MGMKRGEYETYDALGLAELVRRGEVSAAELLDEAIAAAEERNPMINAITVPMYREAREAVTAGLPEGPFRGVPFLLKDLYAGYTGVRTTNGCRFFQDFVADHDSELVARYRRAGLVILGKAASPEFGLTTTTESRLFGKTLNPWNSERTAGGSSGGSAAAVAAGIVPAAHATDGGGSIRVPASCCGLFGLKPTRARVPMGPDVGEGWSGMSAPHVVTRSVRDSAALLDATAGAEEGDPYWAPPIARPFLEEVGRDPGRLRIALQTRAFNGAATDPDCETAVREGGRLCAELGHDVEEAVVFEEGEALADAVQVIVAANLRATLEDRGRALGREYSQDDVEPVTYATAAAAQSFSAAQYARSIRVLHATGRQVARVFTRYDLMLTPTMAVPPLPLGAVALTGTEGSVFLENLKRTIGFTRLMNVAGNPAMSVPLFWNSQGLPIGVQFAAAFGGESTLFRLAGQLEAARPWAGRRPALGSR